MTEDTLATHPTVLPLFPQFDDGEDPLPLPVAEVLLSSGGAEAPCVGVQATELGAPDLEPSSQAKETVPPTVTTETGAPHSEPSEQAKETVPPIATTETGAPHSVPSEQTKETVPPIATTDTGAPHSIPSEQMKKKNRSPYCNK